MEHTSEIENKKEEVIDVKAKSLEIIKMKSWFIYTFICEK